MEIFFENWSFLKTVLIVDKIEKDRSEIMLLYFKSDVYVDKSCI